MGADTHGLIFVTPIDFFWDLTEKSRGFEPLTFEKTSPSLIDGAVFSAASFAEVTFGGALGTKAVFFSLGPSIERAPGL